MFCCILVKKNQKIFQKVRKKQYLCKPKGIATLGNHEYKILADSGMADVEMLFRKYYAPMVLYALKAVKDKDVAEDVVQDVFSRIIQKGDHLTLGERASYLLFTSLRNAVIDYQRRSARHYEEPMADAPDEFSIEDSIFEIELYQQLYDAIKSLPAKNRRVLELRLEGMDEHAIAEELGISYETVRSHIKHATERLRTKLGTSYLVILVLLS